MANGLWKLLSSTTAGTPSLLWLFKQDAGGTGGNDETMIPENGAVRNAGDVMPTAVVEPFRMFQVADIERRDVAF